MWEKLWRGTVTLAREDPLLWLPVVAAELAGFALRTYKVAFVSFVARIVFRAFPGHSVLIGAVQSVDDSTPVFLAASFIGFLITSAPIVLYAAAFFLTARRVLERDGVERGRERLPVRRGILALSVRGLLVGWTLAIAITLIFALLSSRWHVTGLLLTMITDLMSGTMMLVFAYVMVPPALRLLPGLPAGIDQSLVSIGRTCAMAAVVASTALIVLQHIVIGVIHGARSEVLAVRAVGSVLAALPYAPLYVALGLLAGDQELHAAGEDAVLAQRGI